MSEEPNNSTDEPRPADAEGVVGNPAPSDKVAVSDESAAMSPADAASDEPATGSESTEPVATSDAPEVDASEPEAPDVEAEATEEEPAAEEPERHVAPLEEAAPPEQQQMDWYILKVQSNREDSIRDALERRIARDNLGEFFDEIIVPVEMVSEFKNGKKRVVKRKLYPGYIVVHMILNDDTWFLVRETPGIGDFTGSGGKPTPMLPQEVNKIISKAEEKTDEAPKLKINFNSGDRVKITEGTFENFEGDVDAIDQANGRVTVMINIFGRSTPVELEYWQVESL